MIKDVVRDVHKIAKTICFDSPNVSNRYLRSKTATGSYIQSNSNFNAFFRFHQFHIAFTAVHGVGHEIWKNIATPIMDSCAQLRCECAFTSSTTNTLLFSVLFLMNCVFPLILFSLFVVGLSCKTCLFKSQLVAQ